MAVFASIVFILVLVVYLQDNGVSRMQSMITRILCCKRRKPKVSKTKVIAIGSRQVDSAATETGAAGMQITFRVEKFKIILAWAQ